jgi:hypothetical protein
MRTGRTTSALLVLLIAECCQCASHLNLVGRWPGHPRGSETPAVDILGNYAYVAQRDGGMWIYDVRDPTDIIPVGGFESVEELPSFYAEDVHVVDQRAYVVATYGGLHIFDVENPRNVIRLGRFSTGNYMARVEVVNSIAYVGGLQYVRILDVQDPSNIRLLATIPGSARHIHVRNGLAYVARWAPRFEIYDVSTPANPIFMGSCNTSGDAFAVQIVGHLAYVAVRSAGLQVLDVSNPTNIVSVTTVPTGGVASDVRVSNQRAYVADHEGGLRIFDLSTPSSPRLVGSLASKLAVQVKIIGDLAYMADHEDGLKVVDVATPNAPELIGGLQTSGRGVGITTRTNLVYMTSERSGLEILDVRTPDTVKRIGHFDSRDAMDVQILGTRAYLADRATGLHVLDISNASNIVRIGHYPEGIYRVHVTGTTAYVAGQGVQWLHLGDPTNITVWARYTNRWNTFFALTYYSNFVYAGGTAPELEIFDSALRPRGRAFLTSRCTDVQITNGLAYVATEGDFEIFNVSNIANIVRIGSFKASAFRVQVVDGIAYLGAYLAGVLALDVRNPTNIVQLANFDTITGCLGIGVAGNRVFTATSPWGLSIFELGANAPPIPRFTQSNVNDGLFQTAVTPAVAAGTWVFEASSNLVDWSRIKTSTESTLEYPVSSGPDSAFFRASRR